MSAPVYPCISAVEICELAEGDIANERVEELLDHIDDCDGCSRRLQTIVILKAHRREAIALLRRAHNWKEGRPCSDLSG